MQDLLVISRMEAGQVTMHEENFCILDLAREIFDQLEDKAKKKGAELESAEGVTENISVHADKQRIHQVMTNLVSNAIKYIKGKGKVTVGFEKGKNQHSRRRIHF